MKTCDSDNNRIKLYKKITELSKSRKDGSTSNSKNKVRQKLNTININKLKEGQFRNYMNLQNIKKNTNNSRTKKIKKEKTNRVKNNKTMLGESNQINKDFNLSINNNDNKNNSIAIEKNNNKKGIFLSKYINNLNNNNRDKFIINYKIKFKKTKKLKAELGLKQLYFNQIKNNELNKQNNNKNSLKKSNKENNNLTNVKNHKINTLKIESIPKMSHFLNDFKTTRIAKNRYVMNSVSISQSKSKTKVTRTSNSSNSKSQSKSKSNSIKDNKINKDSFFAFKSSRNNCSKSKSGNKQIDKKYTNLTQEKLSNLKCITKNNIGKDINNYIKNNIYDLNKHILNKKTNIKGSINSKSKKKKVSKPKNNYNYFNNVKNFKTSKEHHKLKKIIKPNNYMHILISDKNNIIQRHNTNIMDNKSINDNISNIYLDQKQNQSVNFGVALNTNKNRERIKSNIFDQNILLKKSNKYFNVNNKIKKPEQNIKDKIIMTNYLKQKNNLQKSNVNQIKKSLKENLTFHSINNFNKFKEYNKYSTLNNASNIQDEISQDFLYDFSNLKISSKNKTNKLLNNQKINKSNKNKNFSKKKIKIGDLKQIQFKNLPFYQDIKPQTYRKDK